MSHLLEKEEAKSLLSTESNQTQPERAHSITWVEIMAGAIMLVFAMIIIGGIVLILS